MGPAHEPSWSSIMQVRHRPSPPNGGCHAPTHASAGRLPRKAGVPQRFVAWSPFRGARCVPMAACECWSSSVQCRTTWAHLASCASPGAFVGVCKWARLWGVRQGFTGGTARSKHYKCPAPLVLQRCSACTAQCSTVCDGQLPFSHAQQQPTNVCLAQGPAHLPVVAGPP